MSERALYRHHLRCRACAHRFHVDRVTADPDRVRPHCPRCRGKTKQSYVPDIGMDVSAGRAPGVVGANVQTKAYDITMENVMREQQLGDVQDHSRPGAVYRAGEPTAPKLPAHLQVQADNLWGSASNRSTRTAKVDLSGVLGATPAINGQPPGQRYTADAPSAIAPIVKSKPPGSSPIPPHTIVAG